ncbi:hypothetical protein HDU87_000736 [Geranomyces variabilis]|uniref:Uncharacterized protein n=1 Tax=Geranomyces variabilis TaxID=109894 RepID=A0AAD5XU61_9FUNG|nr:hypothetical protein HDU87_000736 [Geranomyces variabilis]
MSTESSSISSDDRLEHPALATSLQDVTYWRADALMAIVPGCGRTQRTFTTIKNVPRDKFIYGLQQNGRWSVSNNQDHPPKQAKVLIEVDWAKRNLANDLPLSNKRKPLFPTTQLPAPKRQHIGASSDREREDDISPPILELNDDEKFKNAAGEIVEIETRGQRRVRAVFFKASDVSALIDGDPESMRKKLLHPASSYVRGAEEDFVTFRKSEDNMSRDLFLTYMGAMRAFATSRMPNSRPFLEYAVRVVQTVQMGNDNDRVALAANLAKADLRTAQYVFKECIPPPAGVYLISIGTFKDLHRSLGLTIQARDDDEIVKFGRSDNCAVRMSQHLTDYGALRGARPTFLAQIAVNPFKSARCEELVKRFFAQKGRMLDTSGNELLKNDEIRQRHCDELAIIPKAQLRTAKEEYKRLGADFGGAKSLVLFLSEILTKNAELEKAMEQQMMVHERVVEHLTELSALKLQSVQDLSAVKLAAAENRLQEQQREIEQLKEIFALKLAAAGRDLADAHSDLAERNRRIEELELALQI